MFVNECLILESAIDCQQTEKIDSDWYNVGSSTLLLCVSLSIYWALELESHSSKWVNEENYLLCT